MVKKHWFFKQLFCHILLFLSPWHRHVGIFNIVTPIIKALKSVIIFFFCSMGIFAWCLSYLWAALTSFRICMCVQAWACIFCFSAYSLSFQSSLAYLPLSLTEQLKALQWILAANSDIWLQTKRVSLLIILSQERERYTAPSMLWNFIACWEIVNTW